MYASGPDGVRARADDPSDLSRLVTDLSWLTSPVHPLYNECKHPKDAEACQLELAVFAILAVRDTRPCAFHLDLEASSCRYSTKL